MDSVVFFIFVGGSGKIVLLIMETSNSQLMVICLDNSFKIIDYLSLKVRILYRLMAVFRLRPSCLYGVINIPEIAGAATICTVELLRKRCRACETAGRCNFPDGKIRVCDELSGNLHFAPPSGHRCVCQRTLGGDNGQHFNQLLSVQS